MSKQKTPLLDKALPQRELKHKDLLITKEDIDELKQEAFACPPPLEYIKIPLVGDRTPERMADSISDLLCWFEGLEFGTPEEKQSKLSIARGGINTVRDIQMYIKNPMK